MTAKLDVLLLHPPATIPSEPPLSLAILATALKKSAATIAVVDANLEAYNYLLDKDRLVSLAGDTPVTAVRRALNHRQQSIDLLRSPAAQKSFPRYSTAVRYLNLLLGLWADKGGERLTFSDYTHNDYSVFNPDDLNLFSSGAATTLFQSYFAESLLPQIVALQPRRVAISINYLHQVFPAFSLAGMLRRQFTEIELIAGGGLITSWQEPLRQSNLKLSPFDRLVFGPGEASLVALNAGKAKDDYYLSDVSSIGYTPDYSGVDFQQYFSPEGILPLSASRGCYWQKCLFCPEATAPVHPYGSMVPSELTDIMLQLAQQYRVKTFHLTDNAIPVNILRQIALRRAELNTLSWFGFVRFEAALESFELVEQLAVSGCKLLQLGLESGSQAVLDRLGKGLKLATAEKILDNLHRAGITSYVYIMLGTPGETEADAEMTLEFLERYAEKIGFLNISIMNLPRGSGLLDNPEVYGIDSSHLRDEDSPLGLYHEFKSATGWDRAAARRFLNQRLLGSPAIKEIVKRDPPVFSSNHAVFFGY